MTDYLQLILRWIAQQVEQDKKVFVVARNSNAMPEIHNYLMEAVGSKARIQELKMSDNPETRREVLCGATPKTANIVVGPQDLMHSGWRALQENAVICTTHPVTSKEAVQIAGRVRPGNAVFIPLASTDEVLGGVFTEVQMKLYPFKTHVAFDASHLPESSTEKKVNLGMKIPHIDIPDLTTESLAADLAKRVRESKGAPVLYPHGTVEGLLTCIRQHEEQLAAAARAAQFAVDVLAGARALGTRTRVIEETEKAAEKLSDFLRSCDLVKSDKSTNW